MRMSSPRTLRDYTSIPFEVVIVVLTILPFVLLAYFYSILPDRVPLFMHWNGEVAQWAEKTPLSVFRVPLLAVVTQVVCLLMKYGSTPSNLGAPRDVTVDEERLHEQSFRLNANLWDWFRGALACKMIAESVDTIFLSLDLKVYSQPIFIVTWIASLLGAAGAVFYGYRLVVLKREIRKRFGDSTLHNAVDPRHVYGGFLYFNRSDSALFSHKYFFNFGNKWVWVFLACIIAYPILVFGPK